MQAVIYLALGVSATIFILFAPIVKKTPEIAIGRGFILAAMSSVLVLGMLRLVHSSKPGVLGQQLVVGLEIFKDIDTLFLSMLYIMTFSSFLGYAGTFGKLIKALYPGRVVTDFSWMPALLGSCSRIVGGVVSDKYGGAKTTGCVTVLMTTLTFALGFVIRGRMASDDTDAFFPWFVLLHALLFITTGFGNATVFKLITDVNRQPDQRGPLLGWTGTLGAFGGAIFPTFFDASIKLGVNDLMYYLITIYYGVCMLITWRYCFWMGKKA